MLLRRQFSSCSRSRSTSAGPPCDSSSIIYRHPRKPRTNGHMRFQRSELDTLKWRSDSFTLHYKPTSCLQSWFINRRKLSLGMCSPPTPGSHPNPTVFRSRPSKRRTSSTTQFETTNPTGMPSLSHRLTCLGVNPRLCRRHLVHPARLVPPTTRHTHYPWTIHLPITCWPGIRQCVSLDLCALVPTILPQAPTRSPALLSSNSPRVLGTTTLCPTHLAHTLSHLSATLRLL